MLRNVFGASLLAALSIASGFAGNDRNYTYLALGDSVAYGLDIRLLTGPPFPTPDDFIGYPEKLADLRHVPSNKEVNASCPGETSGSFINVYARDNGCHGAGPDGQPPFKPTIGLHTNYEGSQLDFAVNQLSTNKHINLVTLGIGSNDALLLLKDCANNMTCVNASLPGLLLNYARNLKTILNGIRKDAKYDDTLLMVLYYSPQPALNTIAIALNAVTAAVAIPYGVRFADGFTAFQLASLAYGGDPCKAGLLIPLAPGVCDIHPSPKGRDLLAATANLSLIGVH